MNKKYLGEIIKERNYELGTNTLIVAPVGSGKTHYIFNDLAQTNKVLYLCDTNNLEEAVTYEANNRSSFGNREMNIMTYQSFGMKIQNDINNELINKYDYVICDEIHNLINYQSFSNSEILKVALYKLFVAYENTKIVFLTATPYYLEQFAKENQGVDVNFITYNLSKDKEIKRYINRRKAYITHISQIQFGLKEYEEAFMYGGMKCMIFTSTISEMEQIEEMCRNVNLNPISIWSENNQNKRMTDAQVMVRKHLIRSGELLEPYNVLIINRATETGVNITDENIQLVIINNANLTLQIQARGRIRHDIDLLVLKTNKATNMDLFTIDDEYLDIDLTKEEIENEIIFAYGLRDNQRKLYTVNKFIKALENRYVVKKSRKQVNGVQSTYYYISKK